MKIAVIGATGLVGQTIVDLLDKRCFPLSQLILVASSKSVGKKLKFKDKEIELIDIESAIKHKPDITLFAAGGAISLQWAQPFVNVGSCVIDNSSAWRMNESVKLIVPEINAGLLKKQAQIISNPNCSTIQLVAVLYPLHKLYGLKRIIVSTYQAVSGSGYKGLQQLNSEIMGNESSMAYPYQIFKNCLPHAGNFLENAYTDEEMKLVNESRKILDIPDLLISGTVVRVPVEVGHSESVNIEFLKKPNIEEIKHILKNTNGIIVQDDPSNNIYPMPLKVENHNEVFVGRIRKDLSNDNAINVWIVADNLRKGAATNAVQIAEYYSKLL